MPESQKQPEPPVDLDRKMEELQKAEDDAFMKDYQDISMDSLISKGVVSHEVEIAKGFKVKVRTLRKREELEVKSKMTNYDGAQIYVMDQINTDTLVNSVVSINGIDLPTENKVDKDGKLIKTAFEARKDVILDLGDVLCLALMEEYRALNKALVILIKGSSKNSLGRLLLGRESA